MAGDVTRLAGQLAGVVAAKAVDTSLTRAFLGRLTAGAVRPAADTRAAVAVGPSRRRALVVRRARRQATRSGGVADQVAARHGRGGGAASRAVAAPARGERRARAARHS